MKKVEIKLYSFEELCEDSKNRAKYSHYGFLCDVFDASDYDESLNYSLKQYEDDLFDDDFKLVIENIEDNEYLFFKDGDLANTTLFCGAHPRAGEHILTLHGEDYSIVNI